MSVLEPRNERRENYGWSMPISSRWADCDGYGHVNNAVYYSWIDTAVTTMAIEFGVLRNEAAPSIGLCVASACDFLAPIGFPETIEAHVRLSHIGTKSLRYEVALFQSGSLVPAAVGHFVHVFVDRESRRPIELAATQKAGIVSLLIKDHEQ